ncbi:MAG: hypothetical protein RIR45_1341 [Pseudomonadota bacterium]
MAKRRFKRGEFVMEQGEISNALFIILAGRARVLMTDKKGGEVILATLAAGDYIGAMRMIDGEPHSATVAVEVQTDAMVLWRDDFSRCPIDNAHMGDAVMRGLVRRLRIADNKIGVLFLMSVYGRVANVLLEARAPAGIGDLLIRDKIASKDLAKTVGASCEMVSRVMKEIEEQGFVQTLDGGFLRLVDRRSVRR